MGEERTEAWWARRAWALLSAVRERAPLVQCITNLVSMDIAANALTAAGASPAMLHSLREIPDFTPRCHAVYINVGTLSEDWLPSMRAAASAGRPWVLDPVAAAAAAAAASGFHMEACLELLVLRPAVVRGNASEILALAARSDCSSSFKMSNVHTKPMPLRAFQISSFLRHMPYNRGHVKLVKRSSPPSPPASLSRVTGGNPIRRGPTHLSSAPPRRRPGTCNCYEL